MPWSTEPLLRLFRRRASEGPAIHRAPLREHREPLPAAKAERLRLLGAWVSSHVAPLAAGALAIGVGVGLARFVGDSEYFIVREATISGARRVDREVVIRGLSPGGLESLSLVETSEAELENRLRKLPEVATAEVRKEWPDRLDVTISERIAEGVVMGPAGNFLVDEDGVLFAEASPADIRNLSLPAYTISPASRRGLGESLPRAAFARMRLYARALALGPGDFAGRLSELHYDADRGVSAVLRGGSVYLCGFRPPAETLPVMEAADRELSEPPGIAFADLRTLEHFAWIPREHPEAQDQKTRLVALKSPKREH